MYMIIIGMCRGGRGGWRGGMDMGRAKWRRCDGQMNERFWKRVPRRPLGVGVKDGRKDDV